MHNFKISNIDTDSISFCKQDMSSFSIEEQERLINEINSLLPEKIKMAHDGYYTKVVIARAKNYILYDGKKKTIKGSAFKSSTKSVALKSFMNEIIDAILNDQTNYTEIYNKYVKMILSIKTKEDMQIWTTKKTLTDKIMNNDRTNESKVRDALGDAEYSEGDKFYVYYKEDSSLSLIENFDGNYNKARLLNNLYDTSKTFNTILTQDEEIFVNLKLKRNKAILESIQTQLS